MKSRGLISRTLQFYWRQTRALTLGAQGCVLSDTDQVLLIRHTYRPGWHFPGGGVEKGEAVTSALQRELSEEANIELTGPAELFGLYDNSHYFPGDHIAVFIVRKWTQPSPPKPNREIAEHGFFSRDNLPADIHPSTRQRIFEILDSKDRSDAW